MYKRKTRNIILAIILLVAFLYAEKGNIGGFINRVGIDVGKDIRDSGEVVVCKRVVDGDTIEIADGRKVRYIGVNTPETKDPRKGVEAYGKEASAKNKELVEGKEIRMEKDAGDTDKYGRLLRYVYRTEDDLFVNAYLVENGFASVMTIQPNVKYQDKFVELEKSARENNRGLWGVK